jgi:type VI secretion system protein ImpC
MAERFSGSSVHLDVEAGKNPAHEIPRPDTPFQLLVVGDFSGRVNRALHAPFSGRRPLAVDCDNLDDALAQMGAALNLAQVTAQMTLRFRELDDFSPDRIYRTAEPFRKLAELRDQPSRDPSPAPKPAGAPGKPLELELGRSLLDQMMEAEEAPSPVRARARDPLAEFIERAVAPHLEKSDPGKQRWSERVDATAGELMRAVLHNPDFQTIESAWRAVQMLVQRLDPDSELKIYLLDVTLRELLDDPQGFVECLAASSEPWAAIVGNFAFGPSAEDAAGLRTLGRIAAAIGAPFLAESQPPSDAEPGSDWTALRKSAEARWIGLALPRFLLRLPYGKDTSEVESFAFEEMPRSVHAHYLWGNPAFACACLLGEAFRNEGWNLRPSAGEITGLPLHIYKVDGEPVAKHCAEVLLSEHDIEFILDNGLMPVMSRKNRDSVLLPRMQSITEPLAPLAGRWTAGR